MASENGPDLTWPFIRGREDYRRGLPCPPPPPEDGSVTEPVHARWYGWMLERGVQLMAAWKVRDFLNGP